LSKLLHDMANAQNAASAIGRFMVILSRWQAQEEK
jgi:hypothetical protein